MSLQEQIKFNLDTATALECRIDERRRILDEDLGELNADIHLVQQEASRKAEAQIEQITMQANKQLAQEDSASEKKIASLSQDLRAVKAKAADTAMRLGVRLRNACVSLIEDAAITDLQTINTPELFSEKIPATTVHKLVTVGDLLPRAAKTFDRDLPKVTALLPLLDAGHIIIESTQTDAGLKTLLQSLVAQVYTSVPAGQAIVTVFNPRSNKILADFMPTGASDAGLLKLVQPTQSAFEHTLEEHLDFIVNTQASIGNHASMAELIRATGQHEYPYRILVILDAPSDWSDKAIDLLDKLMSAGAAAGLSIIVHRDPAVSAPDRLNINQIDKYASIISLTQGKAQMRVMGPKDKPVHLKLPVKRPGSEYTHLLKVVVQAARTGSLPNIPLQELITIDRKESTHGLAISMGRKGTQQTEFILGDTSANIQNLLIGGRAGSGKTNLLKVIIYSMAARYPREELELFLLDFKEGGDFIPFTGENGSAPLPNATVVTRDCDSAFGIATLRHFKKEMERRANLTSDNGVANIWDLRKKTGIIVPRWVLIIDEFQGLFNGADYREATDLLEDFVRKGRSFGLHIMLATQTLSGVNFAGDKDRAIFENIAGRIVLQLGPGEFSKFMGNDNDDGNLLRYRGQAIFNPQAGLATENQLFVVARADDDYTQQLQKKLYNRAVATNYTQPKPMVYRGNETVTASQLVDRATEPPREVDGNLPLWFGQEATIQADVAQEVFSPIPGSHVLLLGGDEKSMPRAIATLQTAVLSAVAAADNPRTKVIFFDGLVPQFRKNASIDLWLETLRQLGAEVMVFDSDSVKECLTAIQSSKDDQNNTIIALLGAENSDFKYEADALGWKNLIRNLPRRNVHLIGHWSDLRDIPGDTYELKNDYKTMLLFGRNNQLVTEATKISSMDLPPLHNSRTLIYSATRSQDGLRTAASIEVLGEKDLLAFAKLARHTPVAATPPTPVRTEEMNISPSFGGQPQESNVQDKRTAKHIPQTKFSDLFGVEFPQDAYEQAQVFLGHSSSKVESLSFDARNGVENLLITGQPLSGFTEIAQAALISLAGCNTADSLQIDLIEYDDRHPEFADFFGSNQLPHTRLALLVADEQALYDALTDIYNDIEDRKVACAGTAPISGTEIREKNLLRRVILINDIDGLNSERVADILRYIVKTGPQYAVHIIMVSDSSSSIVTNETLWNGNAGKVVTFVDETLSTQLLGTDIAQQLDHGTQAVMLASTDESPKTISILEDIGESRRLLDSRLDK